MNKWTAGYAFASGGEEVLLTKSVAVGVGASDGSGLGVSDRCSPRAETTAPPASLLRRRARWLLLLGLGLVALSVCAPAAFADSQTFTSVADAHVTSTSPSTNYGVSKRLRVEGSPLARSYLLFDVRLPAGA